MSEQVSPGPDAIFWVGNEKGAALVNYTTGRCYALLTKTDQPYDIRLFLGWFDRFRFCRGLQASERKRIDWSTFCGMQVEFESMFEAIVETDQVLEALSVIPQRVEPWERYYLLRPIVKEHERK